MIGQKMLILGANNETSKQLSLCLKKLTSKVYLQSDMRLFKKEFLEVAPDIIFLDQGLAHSEESNRALNWILQNRRDLLIFGYTDASHAELIAHGIESGLEKTFLAPFQEDEISKAITNHLKLKNKKDRPLLERPIKANIFLKARVISVDENGIKLNCSHYISKGVVFDFTGPICKEIFNQAKLAVMVTKTFQDSNGTGYEIFIEPKENSESTTLSLRRYIMSK